ncbi:universal stress protein [Sphingomonas sp. Leaf38]|uniref:universal stress protein n=1 Tax=Sphingomonas sp. Leaf38 TaxID=1736217 RepID=UPI001F2BE641|nr:universal stress protein [Sphingomonas sp. Leaf38]
MIDGITFPDLRESTQGQRRIWLSLLVRGEVIMLKSVLAVVDNGDVAAPFLRTVARFAEASGAHLEVAVLTPAPMTSPALAPFGALYVPEVVLMGDDAANVAKVHGALRDFGAARDVFGFHDDVAWLAGDLRRSRQVADIIVLGALETWATPWLRRRVAQTLIRASGTPLLILPCDADITRVHRAILGWTPSPEATRALHALIQLAEPDAVIDIVTVGDTLHQCEREKDAHGEVKRHLSRHGFTAQGHWIVNAENPPAETLTLYAKEQNANLLVIGGFAHTRVRDIVLGGVTRDFVESSTVPILIVG